MRLELPFGFVSTTVIAGDAQPRRRAFRDTETVEIAEVTDAEAPVVLRYGSHNSDDFEIAVRKVGDRFYARLDRYLHLAHLEYGEDVSRFPADGRFVARYLQIHEARLFRPYGADLPLSEPRLILESHDAGRDEALASARTVAAGILVVDGEAWFRCRQPVIRFALHDRPGPEEGESPFVLAPAYRVAVHVDHVRAFEPTGVERNGSMRSYLHTGFNEPDLLAYCGFASEDARWEVVDPSAFDFDSAREASIRYADMFFHLTAGCVGGLASGQILAWVAAGEHYAALVNGLHDDHAGLIAAVDAALGGVPVEKRLALELSSSAKFVEAVAAHRKALALDGALSPSHSVP